MPLLPSSDRWGPKGPPTASLPGIGLSALFSALLLACGGGEDDEERPPVTSSGGCPPITGSEDLELVGRAAEALLADLEAADSYRHTCLAACEDAAEDDLIRGPVWSGGTCVATEIEQGPETGTSSGSTEDDDTVVLLECPIELGPSCIGGRGHLGVRSRPNPTGDPVGRWLAGAAHEEQASVEAFTALARELEWHGAPPTLISRVLDAADDERRHAEVMTRLAKAAGSSPPPVVFRAPPLRSLVALAQENASEGCVRETWAALEALHQAEHATDPAIRSAMRMIAADEIRHAELAHDLDRWYRARLGARERASVDHVHRDAVTRLGQPRRSPPELGLPSPPVARRLLRGLEERLWGVDRAQDQASRVTA